MKVATIVISHRSSGIRYINLGLVVATTIVLLAFLPYLVSAFYGNLGKIGLARLWLVRPKALSPERLAQIPDYLHLAVRWNPHNAGTYRLLRQASVWNELIDSGVNAIALRYWREAGNNAQLVDYPGLYGELVDLYLIALTVDPANSRYRYLVGRYLWEAGKREEAAEVFKAAVRQDIDHLLTPSEAAEIWYYLGVDYESKGKTEKAIQSFEEVLELDGGIIDAYYRLRQLYQTNGMNGKAEELEARLANLGPEYALGQSVGNDWILLGYDLDEAALERWSEITVSLYWRPARPVEVEKPGWYRAGERWIEVKKVRNLVPNGAFEWDLRLPGAYPYGWSAKISTDGWWSSRVDTAAREAFEFVIDRRNGEKTGCARLSNSQEYRRTRLDSIEIPVKPDAIYLQAGWIRSENGNAYLGYRWIGEVEGRPYHWVVTAVAPEAWTLYAGIVEPPRGAKSVQLWLLNWESTGKAYFDNILLIELEVPEGYELQP